MGTTTETMSGMDLSGDRFVVEKGMIRNRYRTTTADGTVLLRSERARFSLRDTFTFTDADGETVLSVTAEGIVGDARTFVLRDAGEETMATLENDRTLATDAWTVRDPDDETVATITAMGTVNTFARNVIPFGGWIPHEYEITDGDGTHVGRIESDLSPRDRSTVVIDDADPVPRQTVIVAAMMLNAVHGI